jgi:ribonuclease P protein component
LKKNFRKYRKIKKSSELISLLKKGIKWKNNDIFIYYLSNNKKSCRLGICLSKRNGASLTRNLIKRQIRELFREKIAQLEPHFDILIKIIPKKETVENKDIEKAIVKWCECIKK